MSHLLLLGIFSLVMIVGLIGTVLPLLPGIPFMMVVALIFAILDRFHHLQGTELLILGVIAAISLVIDYFSGILGAKMGGATPKSVAYGLVGFIVGFFLFPPLGGFFGLFFAIVVAEIGQNRSKEKALKAASSSLLGVVAGMAINLLLACIFLILFVIFSK